MNLKDIPSITGAEVGSYFDLYDEFMKSQKEWNKKHDEFAKKQEKFDSKILESVISISDRTYEQHRTVLILGMLNSIATMILAIFLFFGR